MTLGPAWIENAACAGHDPILWDVEWATYDENCRGVQICRGCPVSEECRLDAEAQAQPVGIMAGRVYGKATGVKSGSLMPIPSDFRTHGSRGTYDRGCRCDLCAAAMRTNQRQRELERRVREAKRGPKPCGTHAAYIKHRNHGENPCLACWYAEREYQRERRAKVRGSTAYLVAREMLP